MNAQPPKWFWQFATLPFAGLLAAFLLANTPSMAQDAQGVISLFGNLMGAAISQTARDEWSKLAPTETSCIREGLSRQGASVEGLIQSGVQPNDPRISELRATCARFTGQLRLNFECPVTTADGSFTSWCDEDFARQNDGGAYERVSAHDALQSAFSDQQIGTSGFERSDAKARRLQMMAAGVNSGSVPAPNFDCAKAKTLGAKAICNSYVLSTLDGEYGQLYQRTRPLDPKGVTKAETLKLYRSQNACNGSEACLKANTITGINFMADFLRQKGETVVTLSEQQSQAAAAEASRAAAEKKQQEEAQNAEQQQRDQLATVTATAKALIEEASGFLKSDPTNPNVLPIAKAIASLNGILAGQDIQQISAATTVLSTAVHEDQRFAEFMAGRAAQTAEENARHLSDAVNLANQQKTFLLSYIAQNPTADASAGFIGETNDLEGALSSPDLAQLRTLTDRVQASIVQFSLQERFLASVNNNSEGTNQPRATAIPANPTITQTMTPRNEFLLKGSLEDVVLMFNSSQSSPHVVKNLRGDIVFDEATANVCIYQKSADPRLVDVVRSSLVAYQLKSLKLDTHGCAPDHLLDYDILAVRRGDFLRQEPGAALSLIKQIESQNFKLLAQVAGTAIGEVAKTREIKSREIETDLLNGSIDGYGLVILTGAPSGTVCAAVTAQRSGQAAILGSVSDHLAGLLGSKPSLPTFSSSVDDAFFAVQRGSCGAVYASARDLKQFLTALGREAIPYQVDETWVTQAQVDQAQLQTEQTESSQDQADLERQRRAHEEAVLEAQRDEDLKKTKAAQQAALQAQYGSTAKAAAIAIANEIKGFTDADGNDQDIAASFPKFASWYAGMRGDHWELISINSDLADYGQVTWKSRTLEASLATVSLKLRNQTLGEYRDACFVFGHIVDGEFGMYREPIDAGCDDQDALNIWKRGHAFQSQWLVE